MIERFNNYRRERVASHEQGEATPTIPELCYPEEPLEQHQTIFNQEPQRPVDLTPYEANQVRHWDQRRRAKRITDYGKR